MGWWVSPLKKPALLFQLGINFMLPRPRPPFPLAAKPRGAMAGVSREEER